MHCPPAHILRVAEIEENEMGNDFAIGTDVYVREPQRFVESCTCIVGPIKEIIGDLCVISASIGRLPKFGGCLDKEISIPLSEIGVRLGTPLSKLSGRPGYPGYAEFVRISESWDYP